MKNRSSPLARPCHIVLIGAECEENLAIRYIQSALDHHGHPTRIIPFNSRAQIESAARELASAGAALVGLSMVFTYRALEFAELAVRARQLGFTGHIVAGGHFAAFHAENLLRDVPAIDSVAIGEGEELMTRLADHLDDLSQVPGLVWRASDGSIIRNAMAVKPRDLDALPWPTHKDPPDDYLGLPIANMLSSRGCSHTCDFCSIVAWHELTGGARVRLRSVETVAHEMAALHERGYRIFNFHDDNFLFQRRDQNLKRLWPLHGALRQREIGRVALAIKSRPDSVDRDVFELLRELGVFRVFVGIEAGTDASLRQLGRNQTVADNDRALSIVEDLDFHTCFNILLLNPDSTLEDFAANARYLKRHAQHPLNFCRTEVYAGTPLEKRLRNAGQLRGDYWGYGYTIADARAQRAFELMHRFMFDRHHGSNNVHHLTMRLDYERKLLGHFFRCPEPLDTGVRQFITGVNEQSAEFLLEIADLARCQDTTTPSQDARHQVFREEIREITDRQMREGQLLLQSIRLAATAHVQRDPRNRTTSIGVAATLAVLTGATAHELVVPTTAQAFDMISTAPVGQVSTNQPYFDDQQATNMYSMVIAGILAQQLAPLRNVDVEIVFDEKGSLAEVLLFESPRPKPTTLTDAQQATAQKLVQQLGAESFQDREEATRQLRELGPGVLPLLRETAARSQDPEVVHRSQQLINALDPRITEPPNSNLAARLGMLPPRPSSANKRLNFTVTKKAMEQFKFPTHICEMAPAPLD